MICPSVSRLPENIALAGPYLTHVLQSPRVKVGKSRQIAANARADAGTFGKTGGWHFSDDAAEGLLPVLGDRIQLQQVLMNLILNAAKAIGSAEE